MSEIKFIPYAAQLTCAACDVIYDYRVMPDRSCPECGCPPATIRKEEVIGPDTVRGQIVPNPAQAAFLSAKRKSVDTVDSKPVDSGQSVDSKAEQRRAYKREWMRKQRALEQAKA